MTGLLRKSNGLGKVVLDVGETDSNDVFERCSRADNVQEEISSNQKGNTEEEGEYNHGKDWGLLRGVFWERQETVWKRSITVYTAGPETLDLMRTISIE